MTTSGIDTVSRYLDMGMQLVFWPQIGDAKGPREPEWPNRSYGLDDYREGCRVGVKTGTEIAPGKFLSDFDLDWAPGRQIAKALLPPSVFVFGRAGKDPSHAFYTSSEPIALLTFIDPTDKIRLLELRGTKTDGTIGLQTMVPPSIWSKDGRIEPLTFRQFDVPSHLPAGELRMRACLIATGMLLAKHLGANGFGHEVRLAWAGFLLRAGVEADQLIAMGEAISGYCSNREVSDVRVAVNSTAANLANPHKRVNGGPALAKFLGENGKKIVACISEWLGRDDDFVRNKHGQVVRDSQENIARAVRMLDVELSYNEFTETAFIRSPSIARGELGDARMDSLWLQIDREFKFRPGFEFFEKVIKEMAAENKFHPVRDYLNGLTWDGAPRIDRWLVTYGGATDEELDANRAEPHEQTYLEAVSSIFLIAAVRRIRQPGCKYDEMLVLESGIQGLNKSTALRALCPSDEWFSDDFRLNISTKELIEATLGIWIIEASDLAGKRKAEIQQLKAMLSRQIDGPVRMAYARGPVRRPRHFVTAGTTNHGEYLSDFTGARRFWPVRINRFDVEAIIRDRDQLWAEACIREAAGAPIRLEERLWPRAAEHQEKRRETDPWEAPLEEFVLTKPTVNGACSIPTGELWTELGITVERRDRRGGNRISEIMQRLGFRRTTVRAADGKPVRGYVNKNMGR